MSLFLHQNRFGEMYHSWTSLAHQWILCSEWVPSEWESKQLIKTSQVIHTTPVHHLTYCEVKSCLFVRNKSIIKGFLMLNLCFQLKYETSTHIIAFSGEKSCLIWIGKEMCTDQALFKAKRLIGHLYALMPVQQFSRVVHSIYGQIDCISTQQTVEINWE